MRTLIQSSLLAAAIAFGGSMLANAQTSSAPTPPQTSDAAAAHQYHHHHPMNAARETQHLTKALGLSETQAASVEKILENRQNSVQALQSNTSLDRKNMHQQMHTIQSDTRQAMNQVLSTEQQQQLATLKAEHHRRHRSEGAPASAPAPTA